MARLKKSSFLEGAFIATACIFISKALGILYVIPFKQIVGDQGGALYSYAYNIYNVFLMMSSAGIPYAISSLTSRYAALGENENRLRLYKISNRIIIAFSVLSFAICFLLAQPLAKLIIGDITDGNTMSDVVFVIRSISFTLLIVPLLSVKRGFLQGHKYVGQPSVSQVIEQLIRVAVILIGSYFCTYVLKLPVKFAVGVSVLAAGVGSLAAYAYLSRTVGKNRAALGLQDGLPKNDRAADLSVAKELIICAVPFIIINLANTLYTSTDMILVLKTLPKIGYSGKETEFISSVFTTWGTKYSAIISAVSTGLIVSLIPHIVSSYTKGDRKTVSENFNKCLKIIMLIILPLALFISIMAESFWTAFYSYSETGIKIIRFTILVTVMDCLYMVTNSLLQSLNKKQIIYKSVILGLLTNLFLDVPFMYLFSRLGLEGYYGATLATLCGFALSNFLSLRFIKRDMNLNYRESLSALPRTLLSCAILILLGIGLHAVLPTDSHSRLVQLFNIAVSGIVLGGVYLALNLKLLKTVLPEKLLKKLHLA